MNLQSNSRFWLARGFIAGFGICSIAWAIFSLPSYRAEAPLADSARRILSGERYNAERLNLLRGQLDAVSPERLRSTALNDVAVIRLTLVESDLSAGKDATSDLAELEGAVTAALVESPSSSFLWLIEYWLKNANAADRGLKFLHMSYSWGPNESWIAIRRNPLALRVFSSLPPEIADQVLSEFEGLVRSEFYQEAANILAGPGWVIHEKLLDRLAPLHTASRRAFARALAFKDLEGVVVPGLEADERPSRPF